MTTRACDVAVAGAGPAGIAAALAAAACGARVVLVERDERLGGNVAQALVHTICGLYLPSAEHRAVHAHAGIPRSFAEALAARGAAGDIEWAGSAGFLPIDPATFRRLAEELLADRVELRMRSRVTHADAGSDAVRLRIASAADGEATLEAAMLLDATGDASAAVAAGAGFETERPEDLQHASYIFRIDGVDAALLDRMECARTSAFAARAARRGLLDGFCESIVLRPAIRRGSVYVTMNLPKPDPARFDPLDAGQLERLGQRAAAAASALLRLLAAERPAFADAREGSRPERPGIRETRRVRGVSRLEVDAVLEGRRTDDEACVTTWPIEIWSDWRRLEFRAVAAPASIPLGCLVAHHASGRLAVAGRCASASHEALGAIRVVATAMATGEAAGVACALAARAGGTLATIDAASVRETIASGATLAAFRDIGA